MWRVHAAIAPVLSVTLMHSHSPSLATPLTGVCLVCCLICPVCSVVCVVLHSSVVCDTRTEGDCVLHTHRGGMCPPNTHTHTHRGHTHTHRGGRCPPHACVHTV